MFRSKNIIVSFPSFFKNLGVWFDSNFSFSRHVQNICKSCFAQIHDLKHLRGYVTCHAALMAANTLVGCRLEYCNSLFRSLTALDLHNIGCLLNTILYSRLSFWCTSSYIVVIQTTLYLSLKPRQSVYNTGKSPADGVFLEVSHFATSVYKSTRILPSSLLMMLQRFGMICLMMYVRPLFFTYLERSSKPISLKKHTHPNLN